MTEIAKYSTLHIHMKEALALRLIITVYYLKISRYKIFEDALSFYIQENLSYALHMILQLLLSPRVSVMDSCFHSL